ncbi:hypothetical protein HDU98_009429 [Podochytrium sp. JEL0797]|nr:hypothetical protein HDU98_009429 [Podochytrium sp. JEL0797]
MTIMHKPQVLLTNCLRVGPKEHKDLGDLYLEAKELPGFVRINFSAADKSSSTIHFRTATDAALALDIDDVAFHKPSDSNRAENQPLDQSAKPSSVLYVRMMKGMTPEGLRKIVETIEGFSQFMHTKTFGKIYFSSPEYASKAAERLWRETNIYSYFHHMKSDSEASGESGSRGEESKTVHVQNLDRDFAALYKMFFELPGATRIGYHKGYVFLCFKEGSLAKSAVNRINTTTGMKARTVEFEYSPHFTPGSIGTAGKTIRMNFITTNPTEAEVRNVFSTHPGFQKLHFTSKKCWATFATVETANACLEHFNEHTNIKVVFCNAHK